MLVGLHVLHLSSDSYDIFIPQDIDSLFISLSAVLHLGDITFKAVGNNDSAAVDNPETLEKGNIEMTI